MAVTLGNYRLDAPLGSGGMGSVWRATDTRTGDVVALKRLHGIGATSVAALRREIRALARLDHPNVVRILEEGEHEGLPWYTMELVEGRPLANMAIATRVSRAHTTTGATWTDETTLDETLSGPARVFEVPQPMDPVDTAELLTVLRRLAEALAWLHGEGVVHRDLKPANVVVRQDGSPVLVDFGLTRTTDAAREWLELTDRSGTPAYMSPEQCRGEPADGRADLYALGCLIFELFAGTPPLARSKAAATVQAQMNDDPPRLAARAPGVSEALDQLVADLLVKEPEHRIGCAGTVAARLVEAGARVEPRVGPAPRSRLYAPRFTGRREELEQLVHRIERARQGIGGLCLIGGESGAGKTRLAMTAARRARDRGMRVLMGRTTPGGANVPRFLGLLPLIEPLQELVDHAREGGRRRIEQWFGADGALLSDLVPGLEGLMAGVEPNTIPTRGARVAAAHRVIERAAEAGQLLILDDIQWADEMTLDWLRRHLDVGKRTLVIATYRTEESAGLGDLLRRAQLLDVQRLGHRDIATMAAGMLAMDPIPDALSDSLYEHSEGNPFMAAEILRTAVATGLLARDDRDRWAWRGGHEVARAIDTLPVPRGVDELVEQRAQVLSSDARSTLDAAAVWGRRVARSVLDELVGRSTEADVTTLVASQFLEPAGDELRFVHDKVREGILARLDPERRLELHDRAASLASDAGIRGRHLEGAGRFGEAAAAHVAAAERAREWGLVEQAERLYEAWERCATWAGEDDFAVRLRFARLLAIQRRNHSGAQAQIEAARALGATGAEATARLLDAQGNVAVGRGDYSGALELFRAGWDVAPQDSLLGADLAAGVAVALHGLQRLDEAVQWREVALEGAQKHGDLSRAADQHEMIGQILAARGDVDGGESRMRQAQALYEQLGDQVGVVDSLAGQAWIRSMQGRTSEAVAMSERCLSLARQLGHRSGEVVSQADLAAWYGVLGRWKDALRAAEQLVALHQRLDETTRANRARMLAAVARLGSGVVQPAEARFRALADDPDGLGAEWWDGRVRYWLARVAEERSELDEARRWIGQALPLLPVDPLWLAEAEILQIRIERQLRGDPQELLARLGRVGESLKDGFNWPVSLRRHLEAGWLELAMGRDPTPHIDAARALIERDGQGPESLDSRELGRLVAAAR